MSAVEKLKASRFWRSGEPFTVTDVQNATHVNSSTAHQVIQKVKDQITKVKRNGKTFYQRNRTDVVFGPWRKERINGEGAHTPKWF